MFVLMMVMVVGVMIVTYIYALFLYAINKNRNMISRQYIISQKNLKIEGDLIFIPIYMTGFIKNIG